MAGLQWLGTRLRNNVYDFRHHYDDYIVSRNAFQIINWIWYDSFRLYSGREPVFYLILTNPPRAASIGTPLTGERINILQKRIDDIEWQFKYTYFPWHLFWEKVTVDFVTF